MIEKEDPEIRKNWSENILLGLHFHKHSLYIQKEKNDKNIVYSLFSINNTHIYFLNCMFYIPYKDVYKKKRFDFLSHTYTHKQLAYEFHLTKPADNDIDSKTDLVCQKRLSIKFQPNILIKENTFHEKRWQ